MAVHPDTRRMMDALQRRDLAEIFSQIGNVFEQVLPPGSEIFAIRDRLLTLGAGTADGSCSGSAVVGFFSQEEAARTIRSGYDPGPLVAVWGGGNLPVDGPIFFSGIFRTFFWTFFRTFIGRPGTKRKKKEVVILSGFVL